MTIAEQIFEKLKAAPPAVVREVMDFIERLEAQRRANVPAAGAKTLVDFVGALKGSKAFEGDPVEIQRKLRDEWT